MSPKEINKITQKKLTKLFKYKAVQQEVQAIIDRGFVAAEFKKGKALFVGINPSFTAKDKPESYLYNIDQAITDYPKHYKHFKELVKDTKYENDWTYIDLFQFRETNQKKINLFFKQDIQFIVEQLRITHNTIYELKPEIIIVCNSTAANFFGINKTTDTHGKLNNVWLGYEFNFNKEYGIYVIKNRISESIIKDRKKIPINIPVLFTSTLTYMSKFDKERLNWQIQRISNAKL